MENEKALEELRYRLNRMETMQRVLLRCVVWLIIGLTISIGALCGIIAYITEPQVLRSLFFQSTFGL